MEIKKILKKTNESTVEKLSSSIKNKLNRELDKLTRNTYFNDIPLKKIENILRKHYIILVQEDGTEWEGWLAGESGRTTIDLADINSRNGQFYIPFDNTMLVLTWYQVDSGRYEIVCYVS